MYGLAGFTTTATLYKIEYYLTVKAQLSSAKDIYLRQPIVVCPYSHEGCKEEMEAIAQAAKDASYINQDSPYLPAPVIVKQSDPNGLKALGMSMVAGQKKPLIE